VTARVFIGMGSNLGERAFNLRKASELLAMVPSTKVIRSSSVYETSPVGLPDQPRFLNAVIELMTSLTARDLLKELKKIEKKLGRKRTVRWGPRIIDLDLLLYGDDVIALEELTVPHPGLSERKFVLVPLAELDPAVVHPVEHETIGVILARCTSTEQVERYQQAHRME